MKIVVIGKSGQLSTELAKLDSSVVCLGRSDVDVFDREKLKAKLVLLQPDAVINASAYTAVDKAEKDIDEAYRLNHLAVENMAIVTKGLHAHFVHISTDYVFSGDKGSPYLADDKYAPQGVYGASKAKGEIAIRDNYYTGSCVIRTSWVYASHGQNFVRTMLRLMQEKPSLGVIDDQIGTPTSAKSLAEICLYAAKNRVLGFHHFSNQGVASWYDFAEAIQELAIDKGLLEKAIPINPISTQAYPTPAKRPSYSVLDKQSLAVSFPDVTCQHWRRELSSVLDELAAS